MGLFVVISVSTNAAAGKSNIKALVYIAAFVPDVGQTQGELINKYPGSDVLPGSVPVPYTKADGTTGTDLYLSKDGQAAFRADIPKHEFDLLQATQRPFDQASFTYPTTAAAWTRLPRKRNTGSESARCSGRSPNNRRSSPDFGDPLAV